MNLAVAVTKKLMKFKFLLVNLLAFILLTLNFTLPQRIDPLKRKWMLVSFNEFSKEYLIQQNAYLDLSSQNNLFEANFGCHKAILKAKRKKNKSLKLYRINSKTNSCTQGKNLETVFLHFISNEIKYEVEGHFLTLKNKKGMEMKLIAEDWD